MRDEFQRRMSARSPIELAWGLLHDVDQLADCSSNLGAVATVEEGRTWTTSLEDRVGPFKLSAPMKVEITNETPLQRVEIQAVGQDRGLGTRLAVDAAVDMQEGPAGIRVTMSGTYDVTGRVATLGGAVVKRQANSMIDEFWSNLAARLGGETE